MESLDNIPNHVPRKAGKEVVRRIRALKIGQKMQDLPEELWHESFRYYVKEDPNRQGGPNLRMIRLDPRKPSLTVTGYIFNKFVHPHKHRFITPREAARLQGFPDDFVFAGPLTSVQMQVGNAVPVHLAQAIGSSILQHISENNPEGIGKTKFRDGLIPVVSLFSGAGGLDIGFEEADNSAYRFHTRVAIEFDAMCCETLRNNFGSARVLEGDITKIRAADIMRGTRSRSVPIVIGGPPCQAFSQAGKQNGKQDARGMLVFDYLRLLKELSPTYFVMENVAGLRSIHGGALLKDLLKQMAALGYNVSHKLMCAADYGAPQLRKRYIFVGVKKRFGQVELPDPTHGPDPTLFGLKPYVGVGEAFSGLP